MCAGHELHLTAKKLFHVVVFSALLAEGKVVSKEFL
jgi:hypothetical protein